MIAERLLYLHPLQLSAYVWVDGRLTGEGSFSASREGLAGFADYLKSCPSSRFRILANLGEESQRVETIPYLLGRDRQALIDRKMGQFFPGKPLTTVTSLGYEKDRRRNERLLLTALTNPAQLAPWLDIMTEAEAPLAGLYALSQMAGRLLARLKIRAESCLLLTVQDQSIRESHIVDGETIFSRLVPIANQGTADLPAALAAEAVRLEHYLLAQRQISRADPLPVFVIAHPGSGEAVRSACSRSGKLGCTVLDSHAVARALGYKAALPDNRSEQLFLHLLALSAPRRQFAPRDCRRAYHLLHVKRTLTGIGAGALLAALLFAACRSYDSHALRLESADLALRASQESRRHEEIRGSFPKLAVDSDTLRSFGNGLAQLERIPRHPLAAYQLISAALAEAPAVEIDSIEWRVSPLGGAAADGDSRVAAPPGGSGSELTILQGKVRLGQDASPREVMAAFQQFVQALHGNSTIRVEVLQQPIEMDPSRILKGGDHDGQGPGGFVIEISRGLQT